MSVIRFAKMPSVRVVRDVVALYVSPLGPYPRLVYEWYDAKRDARLYTGSKPVVAHPPCGPWGPMRAFCTKQDAQLAIDALLVVRSRGGVLEHPKGSMLWAQCNIPAASNVQGSHAGDTFGGFTIEINQVWFGHKCLKPTWLYICAPRAKSDPYRLRRSILKELDSVADRERVATHIIAGNARSEKPNASLRTRTLTPEPLARWLISIARRCVRKERS